MFDLQALLASVASSLSIRKVTYGVGYMSITVLFAWITQCFCCLFLGWACLSIMSTLPTVIGTIRICVAEYQDF